MPDHPHVLVATLEGQPQMVTFTLVTINTYKTMPLSHCHAAWNIPNQERLDYHFLAAKFGQHFQSDEKKDTVLNQQSESNV